MTAVAAVLAALAVTTPSDASMDVIEAARRDAPNVVVFRVTRMRTPLFRDRGICIVDGRVIRSERGTLFAPDAAIRLKVPCARQDAKTPEGPVRWVDMPALKRSGHGRAHLDEKGALVLGEYELYDLH